jgi:hypothetical protein
MPEVDVESRAACWAGEDDVEGPHPRRLVSRRGWCPFARTAGRARLALACGSPDGHQTALNGPHSSEAGSAPGFREFSFNRSTGRSWSEDARLSHRTERSSTFALSRLRRLPGPLKGKCDIKGLGWTTALGPSVNGAAGPKRITMQQPNHGRCRCHRFVKSATDVGPCKIDYRLSASASGENTEISRTMMK